MTQSALILQRQNRVIAGFYNNNPTSRIGNAQTITQIHAGNNPVCIEIANRRTLITPPCRCPEIIPTPTPEPISICTTGSLNTIAGYLRNYITEFRNPNFWGYTCDGGADSFIYSGGGNMLNQGHFTSPWLLSGDLYVSDDAYVSDYPYHIVYSTSTESVMDTDFNYLSLGWIAESDTGGQQVDQSLLPTTVLGYRCSGPVGWQIGGNIGYGTETVISGYIHTNANVNGFTVYAGYRQVYNSTGESRVSKCHLFILLGHPIWASVFGPVSLYSDDTDSYSCGCYMYAGAGSENILALCTLLSKTPETASTPISDSELQVITGRFIQRIKEAMNL